MKKLFCIIAAIVLVFGMTVSAEESKVTVIGMSATVGKLVDLRISLAGNTGLDSLTLDLKYDSSALLMYEICDTGLLKGAHHGYNEEAEGFRLCWTEGGSADGPIAIITFMVTGNAEAGSYVVTALSEDVSVIEGFVKVCEDTPGDVTGDGVLDTEDAEAISEYAAGWSETEVTLDSGDINGDGKVNLLDAIIVARNAAGKVGYIIDEEWEKAEDTNLTEHDYDEE